MSREETVSTSQPSSSEQKESSVAEASASQRAEDTQTAQEGEKPSEKPSSVATTTATEPVAAPPEGSGDAPRVPEAFVDDLDEPEDLPKPKKSGKARRVVGIVFLALALGLGITAISLLVGAEQRYAAQDEVNEELAQYVEISDEASSAPVVDWAGLKAIDPNVCAWVQIPGTDINFPVYQGSDNEYYLHYTAYGEEGIGGQVFLDCENTNPGLVDEQTVIFGHHLQNGAMFAPLAEFDDQGVFNEHPTVWYVTEAQAYELQPLLCYRTVGSDVSVRTFNWPSEEEFHNYLSDLLSRSQASVVEAPAVIAGTHHVLTMSTCSYEEDDGRTILVSVPKGEVAEALANQEAALANQG